MTPRRALPLGAALAIAALVSSPGAGPCAVNETPARDTGLILQPFKNQPGFQNDAAFADSALAHQDYGLERLFDTNLDGFATSKVSDFVEGLQAGQGAVVISTHGNDQRFGVEVYGDAYLNTLLARWQVYAQSGYDTLSHLYWTLQFPPDLPPYCAIGLTSAGVTYYFNSSKTIVYAAACYSIRLASAWDGARCVLGYPGTCDYATALGDFQAFWNRLDGRYGKAVRSVTSAWVPTQLSLQGNGSTVLSPTVLSFSPSSTDQVPCGFAGFVRFDAKMDTQADADLAVAGVTQVRVDSVRWTGDDTIDFTVHPLEYATIRFRLEASVLRSANSGGLFLDGNLNPAGSDGVGPSGDDFEWTAAGHCDDDYPEAWVEDVAWREGRVEWASLFEKGSKAYRLAGSRQLVGGDWVPASAEVSASGAGTRYALSPTSSFPYYRVEERELRDGSDRWLPYTPIAAVEAAPPAARPAIERGPRPTVVLAPPQLLAAADRYRLGREALGLPTRLETLTRPPEDAVAEGDAAARRGPDGASRTRVWGGASTPGPETNVAPAQDDLAIVFPFALNATGAITAYATDKQALGWDVTLVPKGGETYSQIKACVDSLKAAGTDAFLFFGVVREGNGPGTTMPATVEPDSNSNFYDFSLRSDTLLTLWDYEKSSSTPGRVGPWVGYVPLQSASEAWNYADKMTDYEWNGRFRTNWDNYSSWGWDVAYGGNSTAQIVADVAAASALVPASWEKEAIWGSQVPQGWAWSDMAAASLNSGQGIVLALATASAPDDPAHWLNGGSGYFDPWTDLAANFKYPLLLSLSCGSNMIDAVHPDDLPVVVPELLAVPDRGIIGAIGPTRGFYEPYYALYARRFWELYGSGRYFFVGDLHKAVRNSLLDEFPSDPLMPLFCRLLILAGDPTATLPGADLAAVTGVAAGPAGASITGVTWLGAPRPNPFNPHVRLEFGVGRAGRVRLRVLDSAGRDVATLLDRTVSAGRHEVSWDGRGASGHPVGAGAYFFEMRSGDERRVEKAILLR